jgi:Ran GTPase-activating protein (RanGAP) involved in mRNA processing and transport
LAVNTSLREISLKGNEMGDKGVKAICEALQGRSCELVALDLGNNSISSGEGARAVASLLRIQTSITDLVLYMNDLGDAGVGKVSLQPNEQTGDMHLS